ncbi:MAG: protein restricted to Verrucomicrobia-Planctomycetes group [Verrucomicrobiales bacterium]|nr:protein restricted to Verrucomicrobia-Planctomycetes group [Verrucomicrobiales bacterium]
MQQINFEETLDAIIQRNPRYHREAYIFLREALDYTQKMVAKGGKDELHHVTGQELLAGIRAYALHQFGPMAMMVLQDWGVNACEDFGELVFNMVEASLLAKTENDTRADFKGGYDFFEAFRRPFLPTIEICLPLEEPKPTRV